MAGEAPKVKEKRAFPERYYITVRTIAGWRQRDVHARNFGDMPLWDRLFGTYAEPTGEPVALGFAEGRGRRVLAMIACVDVNRATGRIRL